VAAIFFQLQQDIGRAEDVTGVKEADADVPAQRQRFFVACLAAEKIQRIEGIEGGVKGLDGSAMIAVTGGLACLPGGLFFLHGLFFLQVGGVQHHQPGQLPGRGGSDDLALEAALGQQGNPSAVVEVGVSQ